MLEWLEAHLACGLHKGRLMDASAENSGLRRPERRVSGRP